MANVTSRTANWRLLGGGGLILGGLLLAVQWLLALAAVPTVATWLYVIGFIVVAVALAFVAFGETGSNGAVGKYVLGKIALVVYAAGFLLIGINAIADLGTTVTTIAGILVIVGGLVSAYAIYQKHVAKGAARWFLFVPAVIGALVMLGLWVAQLRALSWLGLLLALALLVTGVLYLMNDRKIG